MCKVVVSIVTIGMAAISFANPAQAGNGSAVGAGLLGFGVGALVGSAVTPETVYVARRRLSITPHLLPFI